MAHLLSDVMPSLLASLGVSTERNALGVDPSPGGREALLLIDGLGSEQLAQYAKYAPRISSMISFASCEAPFPSTTATSLTSLGTGVTASQHGMFGYTVRVPESGTPPRLLNALKWDERVDPIIWQSHSTVFERARAADVRPVAVSARHYEGTGFTQAALRGTDYFGVSKSMPFLEQAAVALEEKQTIAYLYLNDLDAIGHAKGVGSAEWLETLTYVDDVVDQLIALLPSGTRLWVTGDHGMINASEQIDMGALAHEGIEAFAGEARARHIYTRPGAAAEVAAAWREWVGDRVDVVLRDEAIADGWFGGPVSERLALRIGDILAVPSGQGVLIDPERPKEGEMIGHHGGRSSAEIGVPLRMLVADAP
jgi:hypothetical protein